MQGESIGSIWQNVWQKVKTYEIIDNAQIDAFFSRLEPQVFSEGFLMLTADTEFIRNWIETRYKNIICQALEELYGVPFTIAIEVDESRQQNSSAAQGTTAIPQPAPSPVPQATAVPKVGSALETVDDEPVYPPSTDPTNSYKFDNFVIGTSNRIAYSMALSVAETPGSAGLNPLFIYGKSGLGKTHLLRSIENYILSNYRNFKPYYINTMEFVNDYTEAAISSDSKAFSKFKQRFETIDVLLIDDVQSLQNKDETLNMVFQIFNRMVDSGKQVVLAADRAPKHIDIEERYQSRFSSGGIQDIQPPEVETKLGILRNYLKECRDFLGRDFDIPPDIQEYIAQISSSNIRELKSAVTKIVFFVRDSEKTTITIDEAKRLLDDHFSGGSNKRLNVSDIQSVVEHYYGVSHAELVGKKRTQNIIHARQMAMYLCRTMIDIPFNSIGEDFNRDHSTVMYSVNSIETKLTEGQRDIYEELEILRRMVLDQ